MYNYNTFSNEKPKEITIEDIKKASMFLEKKCVHKKTNKFITRIMNKFGWHSKYEIIVVDINELKRLY